jgi:hypothetical protein
MISFCGVYFHNFTLCHFYALIILFIGMHCITFRKLEKRGDHERLWSGPTTRAAILTNKYFQKLYNAYQ